MSTRLFSLGCILLCLGFGCLVQQSLAQLTLTGVGSAGGGTPATTWNPSDKSANITLDASNLVLTATAANAAVRSVASVGATQKVYFEVVYTTKVTGEGTGFSNSSQSLNAVCGNSSPSNAFCFIAGLFFDQDSPDQLAAFTPSPAQGDNIGVAFDPNINRAWSRINGGAWNASHAGTQDPATGQGGAVVALQAGPYFAIGFGQGNGDSLTTKFSSSSWSFSAPSGFTQVQ